MIIVDRSAEFDTLLHQPIDVFSRNIEKVFPEQSIVALLSLRQLVEKNLLSAHMNTGFVRHFRFDAKRAFNAHSRPAANSIG